MTDLTTRRVPERQEPEHPPDPASRPERAGPPSAVSEGVELSRLLALAGLTAAQALEIGAGVLDAVADQPAAGSGGDGSDRLVVDPVVTVEGRVVLGSTGKGAGVGRPSGAGRSVDEVLADVAAAVALPGPVDDPVADRRLADYDRAVHDLPVAIDRPAVRAELAALVRAIGVPSSGSRPAPRAGPRAGAVEGTPLRARSARRRIGAWLLSILVLAAVVVSEVVFLRDNITSDIALLLDAGRGGSQPSAAPKSDGPHLAAPAPAAAGSVAAVDLRPLQKCAPGAACSLRLQVRLVPAAGPQVVTWTYQVVDRCTGTATTAPGGTVTVPPRADRATAVGVVALPPVAGVAVVAVTAAPAVAASAPMVAGSCVSAAPTGSNLPKG